VQTGDSIFISWRLLGNDPENIGFNVYCITTEGKANRLNKTIINNTNFKDKIQGTKTGHKYFIKTVIKKKEKNSSTPVEAWNKQYLELPVQTPENYRPGDASVADLDGDGQYEIVIHMTGRGRDNGQGGQTSEPVLQAYELDGTLLWEINLGKNIREGAHYTNLWFTILMVTALLK